MPDDASAALEAEDDAPDDLLECEWCGSAYKGEVGLATHQRSCVERPTETVVGDDDDGDEPGTADAPDPGDLVDVVLHPSYDVVREYCIGHDIRWSVTKRLRVPKRYVDAGVDPVVEKDVAVSKVTASIPYEDYEALLEAHSGCCSLAASPRGS